MMTFNSNSQDDKDESIALGFDSNFASLIAHLARTKFCCEKSFIVLFVNAKGEIQGYYGACIDNLDSIVNNIPKICSIVLARDSVGMLLIHYKPDGEIFEENQDGALANLAYNATKDFGISLLDYCIIQKGIIKSFRLSGLI